MVLLHVHVQMTPREQQASNYRAKLKDRFVHFDPVRRILKSAFLRFVFVVGCYSFSFVYCVLLQTPTRAQGHILCSPAHTHHQQEQGAQAGQRARTQQAGLDPVRQRQEEERRQADRVERYCRESRDHCPVVVCVRECACGVMCANVTRVHVLWQKLSFTPFSP